ncbi:MAG: M18 family aminopeptidase [Traorella sp.]
MSYVEECLTFIHESSSMFHAVEQVKKRCVNFIELKEGEKWNLERGKSYFVSRNGSSIIAFTIGEKMNELAFNISASHTDSPTFKLKPNGEVEGFFGLKGNVEGYGGMIVSSWLDRPLRVSGRVCVRKGNKIESMLYDSKEAICSIVNVPIHMNRNLNNGYTYNLQTDMAPLFSDHEKKGALIKRICEDLNVSEEDYISSELYLCADEMGKVWGLDHEFFSSSRIDNLESVYTTLTAFLKAENEYRVNVFAAFDNEEVGSNTKQGADSTFLDCVLKRIQESLGYTYEEYCCGLAHSMLLSVDNAHAIHYNHPEFYDSSNQVKMNDGIVIKSNANQQYTSDAVSCAIFKEICDHVHVPTQYFANRSDVRGGSTLGNISSSHVSIKSVDIGCAQLAMHSCVECAGVKDVDYMIQGVGAFYESNLHEEGDSWYLVWQS